MLSEEGKYKCESCKRTSNSSRGWFIHKNSEYNLCDKCRVTNLYSEAEDTTEDTNKAICSRCCKYGEWKKNKWNTNRGHILCYDCDTTFCWKCHGLVHYNK